MNSIPLVPLKYRHSILLIDDEEAVLEIMIMALADEGYDLRTAGSAEEALAILKESPDVSLIISDQLMPGMTGVQFFTQARHICPDALRVLRQLDLLCFPSRMEGASVTVREAMAMGIPVVAADAPGVVESLAGHGWIAGCDDPRELADCIRQALGDATLRQQRAERARDHARAHYDLEHTVEATLAAYAAYYRRFDKTYHVQHQLESIVLKKRSIPRVAALVEAMFMAELQNQLLTAGHDAAFVEHPVRVDVATGSEVYTLMNGSEQALKAGDMYIADGQGVLSSILYGPDSRSRIRHETQEVLFTVYAPPGIDRAAVRAHLDDIRSLVQVVSPGAETVVHQLLPK